MPGEVQEGAQGIALAVDIGGTSMRVGLVDSGGAVERLHKERIMARTPEEVLGQLKTMVAGLEVSGDLPMGIGLPAELVPSTGEVVCAPNLGWRDVPFAELAREGLARPVTIINDLNAITLGEVSVGAARGCADVLCVYVGTGLGMGIVSAGELVLGSNGFAGELGHVKVDSSGTGRRCGCGDRGCLEAYVSGGHLSGLYEEKTGAPLPTPMQSHEIEAAAYGGEGVALELWEETSDHLAWGIMNAVTLLNPERVVLGGGVLEAAPLLREQVKNRIPEMSQRRAIRSLQIVNAACGDEAGVIGAGLMALGA